MASAGPRRGAIIEGINVTPLVDITLVLLVIFIVTAKIVVAPALPLDLPAASQGREVQTVLSVQIGADGALRIDGAAIDVAALRDRAKVAQRRDPSLRAVIQADRAVPHGVVIEVLDSLQAAGLSRVAFGTAPVGETADSATAPAGTEGRATP